MKKFNIDKSHIILISMIITGVLIAIFFISIFKKLFELSTWQEIKAFIEVFMNLDT